MRECQRAWTPSSLTARFTEVVHTEIFVRWNLEAL
jgi:hypothetical protein